MERNYSGKEWNVRGLSGPIFSAYGAKNWYVCFADEGIVFIPTSIFSALALTPETSGIIVGALAAKEQEKLVGLFDEDLHNVLKDDGNEKWLRYEIQELEKITIQRRILSSSEIHIKLHGQKASVYGIYVRDQVSRIRDVAKRLYADVYEEKGFKK
jgi:hypothetical protein